MRWSEIAFAAVVVAVFVAWLVYVSASRLDRLHRKAISSRLALEAQLVRRASAALELASSGELDPVSSVLIADAATAATGDEEGARALADAVPELASTLGTNARSQLLDGFSPTRAQAESDLSATLRSVLDDADQVDELRVSSVGEQLLDALSGAWFRAQLARRFHNEAVAQAQRMRRKWPVRVFRLAGHAPMPATVEYDDAWPSTFGHAAVTSEF